MMDSLLEKSVKNRLIADVPVGVFLSGGIDSRSIAASLKNKKTNTQLDFYSNLPGVQLYTSQGLRYKNKLTPYQGVCLETQHYPDAPNNKNFPSTLIKPKKLYKYFTRINIS